MRLVLLTARPGDVLPTMANRCQAVPVDGPGTDGSRRLGSRRRTEQAQACARLALGDADRAIRWPSARDRRCAAEAFAPRSAGTSSRARGSRCSRRPVRAASGAGPGRGGRGRRDGARAQEGAQAHRARDRGARQRAHRPARPRARRGPRARGLWFRDLGVRRGRAPQPSPTATGPTPCATTPPGAARTPAAAQAHVDDARSRLRAQPVRRASARGAGDPARANAGLVRRRGGRPAVAEVVDVQQRLGDRRRRVDPRERDSPSSCPVSASTTPSGSTTSTADEAPRAPMPREVGQDPRDLVLDGPDAVHGVEVQGLAVVAQVRRGPGAVRRPGRHARDDLSPSSASAATPGEKLVVAEQHPDAADRRVEGGEAVAGRVREALGRQEVRPCGDGRVRRRRRRRRPMRSARPPSRPRCIRRRRPRRRDPRQPSDLRTAGVQRRREHVRRGGVPGSVSRR